MSQLLDYPTAAWECLSRLEQARPPALRQYDQISMRGADLLAQAFDLSPQLAGQDVLFLGDYDGMAALLVLLEQANLLVAPKTLTLLDFDERVLAYHQRLTSSVTDPKRFQTYSYNVLEPIPNELQSRFDVFYTNPPYGASNRGASVLLFLTRGLEAVKPNAVGYLLYPPIQSRPWVSDALENLNNALNDVGWTIKQQATKFRLYHLDDDPELPSVTYILSSSRDSKQCLPWTGCFLTDQDIPFFYGQNTLSPYPARIPDSRWWNDSTNTYAHTPYKPHLDFPSQSR